MKSLKRFDVSNNKLSGSIPSSFGDTSNGGTGDMDMLVFRAASNNLVGNFPIGLTKIPEMQIIELCECRAVGVFSVEKRLSGSSI
jgi:hypothetical protein